ncbi:hypothetical protein BH11CYA1_BH11CYA1_15630 [soil metagenome]
MFPELYLVLSVPVSCALCMTIYLLATKQQRALIARYNAFSNVVWEVQASLRSRGWEADNMPELRGSNVHANGYDLMRQLTNLAEECIQHRDVAKAWLLIGRIGRPTVESRCDLGGATVRKFYRKLRQYDAMLRL